MNKLWTFGDSFTAGIKPDYPQFEPYRDYVEYLGMKSCDIPESWAGQLAFKLGMILRDFSNGGNSNEEIFLNFMVNCHKINKGDIVILQWTTMNRFLWALPKDLWKKSPIESSIPLGTELTKFIRAGVNTTSLSFEELSKLGINVPKEVFGYMAQMKSEEAWLTQIYAQENLITEFCDSKGISCFFWATDNRIHSNKGERPQYICSNIYKDGMRVAKERDPNCKWPYNDTQLYLEGLTQHGCTSIYMESDGIVQDDYHKGFKGNKRQCELFYKWITDTRFDYLI